VGQALSVDILIGKTFSKRPLIFANQPMNIFILTFSKTKLTKKLKN
jgi:hypothetical protein